MKSEPPSQTPLPSTPVDDGSVEGAALRGPVLDRDGLRAHAAEIATAHTKPVLSRRAGPVIARFAEVRETIVSAYVALTGEGRDHVATVSAEEWLLDNRHVVEEQIREIEDDLPRGYLRKLPRLEGGKTDGYPRVYIACLDYLGHSDARLDADSLAAYIDGYQTVAPLTIGELWAVPIMLRLGLLVVLSTAAREVTADTGRERAARATRELVTHPERASAILARIEREGFDAPLLVSLWRFLREHEASASTIQWIRDRASKLGGAPEDLAHRIHLRQAADQIAVANAIGSMRTINTYEWSKFFERTSVVEHILAEDAGGVYGATDPMCRDRYRHVVERVALRSKIDERSVARKALELARRHPNGARSQVGYYFEVDGRRALERACGARLTTREWMSRVVTGSPGSFYVSLVSALTVAISIFAWSLLRSAAPNHRPVLLVSALLVLAASEIALSAAGALVVALLPPRLLSRLELAEGISPEHRTLVVVPVLFDSTDTVDRLVGELEVRALANPDPNLHFALLGDFCDAAHEREEGDNELVERAVAALATLNARYPLASRLPKYALFHRKRVRNDAQGCFMGWERKRGKLEELNRLIVGAGETTYTVVTAPVALVSSIKYVITLDADTELPRTAALRLVATLAHPLNRPVLDASGTRVVEGYAVIQPRVGTVPSSARRSRYARIAAGPAALDPYTTAVSDVYQDLFGEGSYVGKAIYDVRAFFAVHDRQAPENRLLSHDLYEGIVARTAFASDIELLDDQPPSYAVVARRAHRWIRGDWQLVSLLGRRTETASGHRKRILNGLGLWKIGDNLRRSILGPSSVLALLLGCAFWPHAAPRVALILAFVVAAPIALQVIASLFRSGRSPSGVDGLWRDFRTTIFNTLLGVILFFDQSVLSVDAVARTLYRLTISKRNLLEWQSTGLDRSGAKTPLRMWLEVPALAGAFAAIAARHGAVDVAGPVILCWMLAPVVVEWLSRPIAFVDPASRLTDEDRRVLRLVTRKTWLFFETFVTAEDNWLPPDNFQEEPRAVVAHRTSPTNIGLYLLSTVAARDLGYIGTRELGERLSSTLDTLDRLEKHEGHILNWYDTKTLRPLEPRYVSTVDSGNLAAYLWTVRQACEERIDRPVVGREALTSIADALLLVGGKPTDADPATTVRATVEALERPLEHAKEGEWADRADAARTRWLEEVDRLAPHLAWMARTPQALSALPAYVALEQTLIENATLRAIAESGPVVDAAKASFGDLDGASRAWLDELFSRVGKGASACRDQIATLERVGKRAWDFACSMSFVFLYDADRSLFSIGYNVGTARLDGSRYDLLASEARLASFVAIAKGDVPEKHWFHLGRARCRVDSGRALLSWSGSMFEYLMPLLVLESFPDTLLDETRRAAVGAHREHGKKHGVPWGVSEAAFNVVDLSMTYQYRAFGVPALGLKPGLDGDLVIAPYATALAAMVEPEPATRNFGALTAEGLDGRYGFYDSIDYTASRVPPNRRGVVVKTYMAHHQGMSFVALAGLLEGGPMQRRFHAIPQVKATELLLQERIPSTVPVLDERTTRAPAPVQTGEDLSLVEVVGLEQQGLARVHLLGHGELATTVSSIGTGVLTWRGRDIGRFREDQRVDPSGCFIYLRDLTSGESWSAGFEPTRARASSYGATFSVDHVELHRKDGDIETTTEIVVSPEHAVEVRRITLTNHGKRAREIALTTYTEIVLAPRAADVAHRAFSNMFVEMEEHTSLGAILATRRPQPGEELQPWVVQSLTAETEGWSAQMLETNRARFLGRGGDVGAPLGLKGKLSGVMQHPLDPAIVLRRTVTLAPNGTARLSLVTGVAPSRDEVIALARTYSGSAPIDRAFEMAWADARVELNHLGVSAAQSFRFQRLLSFVIGPHPSLRAAAADGELRGDGKAALWSCGISGDLPLVVLRVDDGELADVCREVLLAHEFFRLNNFAMDLLLLNEEPAGYLQPRQDELVSLVQSTFAQGHLDQRGGVFVRRASTISEDDRRLVLSAARVVLRTSSGSLARQLRVVPVDSKALAPIAAARPETMRSPPGDLLFDNGTGGFTRDGREYVVYGAPPAPWSNVLANPTFGALVSERGGGFTWSMNSQRLRLSPWTNDAAGDELGEAIYLATESGHVWKVTDGVARHRAGGSTFEGTTRGVRHTLTMAVPPDAPVKVSKLVLENETDAPIQVRVCGYVEWVLGSSRESSRMTTTTEWDASLETAFAQNAASPLPSRCSFFRATHPVASMTCDRAEFFAGFSGRARPAGASGKLSGKAGAALDPCAALMLDVVLAPRERVALAFVLGDAKDQSEARDLAASWRALARVDEALDATTSFWDETLGAIQVETPEPALDLMVNRWLLHQVLACRMWGRSAFYQSGGAFGYRDQLQDALALVYARPDVAREHILRAAARQFEEGDVQHWWHPEDGAGIRTRCSDDMLWLAFATLEYCRVTNDLSVLDESVPFLAERAIPAAQRDLFSSPRVSETKGSLYEHCARAIDVALTVGAHGLPLMRAGDWNDGMDRVGAGEKGESVWLAWFLAGITRDFAALAASRGDETRATRLRGEATRLPRAIDEQAWDGAWYRRGYFDDGAPLGSESNVECRIDAIAQAWAVMGGGGDPARAKRAIDEAEAHLVRVDPPMMLLLTPPFEGRGPDPGYIRAYPAGIRENGGQYTHGVLWTVQALAMLGEGARAHALLSKLNPIHHAESADGVKRYAVEPYVVAGDVYSAPEHDGRGGWTWYSGAAGWMYRIAVQWLLGIHIEGNKLTIRPCVPPSWKRYTVRLRRKGTLYGIVVEPGAELFVEVDGVGVKNGVVELADDGQLHTVHVKHRAAAKMVG